MKKILVILLLINVLSACSAQNTIPAPAGTKESNQSQNATMLETGVWPKNTYTDGLPVPAGTVSWAILDTEHENCSISLVDMSEENYNDYMVLLKQEGFSVIEDVSEEVKGQDYVSVGTLLSNNEKGLSISYIPNRLTICISFL